MVVGLVGALAVAGCHSETYLTDDVDLNFDFSWRAGVTQELNTPYVRGASFRVWADRSHDDGADEEELRGWRLEVDDPTIFELAPIDKHASAMGTARRAGTTVLRAIDRTGEVRASEEVRVLVPDRVDLVAHGPLFVGDTMDQATTAAPHILAGGTATFLVRYFADGEPLNGHGVLVAEPTADVLAEERRSFLFEDREWLSLTPTVAGAHGVRLLADGLDLGEVPIVGVDEDEVAMVEIRGDEGDDPSRGESITALGQAYAADGTPVYGVSFGWELDLEPIEGQGDLFTYDYTPNQVSVLDAHGAGQTGTAIVHADEGRVSSSNQVGCEVAPGAATRPRLVLGMLVLGFFLLSVMISRRRS